MQIHELNNFTGTLGSGTYLPVDNGTDTGKISTQQLLAPTEARIDNIIAGDAPSAQEIIDARLGDDGVVYPSLGDAIRDQVSDLKADIAPLKIEFPSSASLWEQGTITFSGSNYSSTKHIRMQVVPIGKIKAASGYKFFVCGLDSTNSFLGMWNGTAFSKSYPLIEFNEFDLNSLVVSTTATRFKIVLSKSDDSTISPSEGVKLSYVYPTDKTLTKADKVADARATGVRINVVEAMAKYDLVGHGNNPQPTDSLYDRRIKLPSWLQLNTNYKLLIRFNNFTETELTSTLRNFYLMGSLNGGTEIEDLKPQLITAGLYTNLGEWLEVDINLTTTIGTYLIAVYSSGYTSAVNSIDWMIFNVDKKFPLVERTTDGYFFGTPINTFGDVLPSDFKAKLISNENDLLIAFVGDSITGKTEYCDEQTNPEHCPAGMQYKSWTYMIWEYISKKLVVCDRLDSQRSGADVFTKDGTWEQIVGGKFDDNYQGDFASRENSVCALTYQSVSDDASVQFTFDASTYEKCNIVYSKGYDGADCEIVVAEGNGKMLVSENRTTWVEANGYQHTQLSDFANGQRRQRHRRLWMKKATGVTGSITITYKKKATQTLETNYMYCWGIEKWKGNAIFVDNLGRGSFGMISLMANAYDIFDRKPDLTVFEMPLANETGNSVGFTTSMARYKAYFVEDATVSNPYSYKTLSDNYTETPLILLLPHNRGTAYDENNMAIVDPNHYVSGDPTSVEFYKRIFAYLFNALNSNEGVKFINVCDRMYNESVGIGRPYCEVFGQNSNISLTEDTTHLNQRGANAYAKYVAPIFQL